MRELSYRGYKMRKGVVYIPDISGFTKLVHEFDIEPGIEILSELLSTIIENNILYLNISEIEGDAILFYRFGPPPSISDILKQYELMLIAFKKKLRQLTQARHKILPQLSLKLIVHYGDIMEYKLYRFKKLYGSTIVDAHRLLKNNIPSHNYILMTADLLKQFPKQEMKEIILPEWVTHQTDNIGELCFTYFLYDTEILKGNVLRNDKRESFG